jgi:hypothetical protein
VLTDYIILREGDRKRRESTATDKVAFVLPVSEVGTTRKNILVYLVALVAFAYALAAAADSQRHLLTLCSRCFASGG